DCAALNASWSGLVGGLLWRFQEKNPALVTKDPPGTLREAKFRAEDAAARLRALFFHIRREWHRDSTREFMCHFPKPVEALGMGPLRRACSSAAASSESSSVATPRAASPDASHSSPAAPAQPQPRTPQQHAPQPRTPQQHNPRAAVMLPDLDESPPKLDEDEWRYGTQEWVPSPIDKDEISLLKREEPVPAEESLREDGEEYEAGHCIFCRNNAAFRQLYINSVPRGPEEEAIRLVAPPSVGDLYTAEFLDGSSFQ
ncbi:unnamed protein product, partial [Prorocentrum cordatum]